MPTCERVPDLVDDTDTRLAAPWWCAVIEPGDEHCRVLREVLGEEEARAWALAPSPGALPEVLSRMGEWGRVWERWHPRALAARPEEDLGELEALGGYFLEPGGEFWPEGLAGLGGCEPVGLWVRGALPPVATCNAVALVGARAATPLGLRTARDIGVELVDRGVIIVSGGAVGIDAAAQRGAVDAGGRTIAVMAGGLAKPYPLANEDLFERIIDEGGALVSEVPPSWRPAKWRFLGRNRVIAAVAGATVVVEASNRSGAMATARRAMDLGREVGAVPGPVTSSASTGCHELIRAGATLVRHGGDALEMLRPIGFDLQEPLFGAPVESDSGVAALPPEQRRVFEALPARSGTDVARLARVSGLGERQVLGALGRLELRGLVRAVPQGWARARSLR